MDSNSNCCDAHTIINMTSKILATSRLIPQFHMKFNFIFKSYYLHIFESQDYNSTSPYYAHNRLSWNVDGTSACSVVVEDQSSLLEDMVEAIIEEIGDRLDEEDLLELIDFAEEEVTMSFPSTKTLPMYTTLCLGFEIVTEHMHVHYIPQEINSAEDVLEKYEVNSCKKGEGPCSFCLEELDVVVGEGGGALKTPCLHVFHGGCIKKWLRTSRSCPFCRSQI